MSGEEARLVIPVTEAQAQKAVMDLFRLYGWQVEKTEEDRFKGLQGLPDLLCTSRLGLQVWVEMKRPASTRNPRGRVRKAQKERLIEWRKRGVPCCVSDGSIQWLMPLARINCADNETVLKLCDAIMCVYDWWPVEDSR